MIITSKHELGEERKDKNTTTDKKRARLVSQSQAHGAAGGCVASAAGNWATAGAALRRVPSSSSAPSPGLRGSFAGDEHPPRTVGTALVIASSYLLQQVEAEALTRSWGSMGRSGYQI